MPIPVLAVIILILIVWLQYEIIKSSRKTNHSSDLFWDNETKSNLVRRTDISHLGYLTITTNRLPLDDKEDQTINSYRDTILSLADKKILNLTGYTNTELKSKYGAANITSLIEYDNNYTIFVSMLQKWAERLYANGLIEDALSVLEYAVSYQTDVTKTYRLLAELYKQQNNPEKIDELLQTIAATTMYDKDKLIQDLKEIRFS